jgi:hypothetical protein
MSPGEHGGKASACSMEKNHSENRQSIEVEQFTSHCDCLLFLVDVACSGVLASLVSTPASSVDRDGCEGFFHQVIIGFLDRFDIFAHGVQDWHLCTVIDLALQQAQTSMRCALDWIKCVNKGSSL